MGESFDSPNNFVDNLKASEAARAARERAIAPAPRPHMQTKTGSVDRWLESTFHGVIEDLRNTTKGNRNNRLRWAARRLSEISHAGLDETRCRRELQRAAEDNGLWADDGPATCKATIESGWGKGKSEPADLTDIIKKQANPHQATHATTKTRANTSDTRSNNVDDDDPNKRTIRLKQLSTVKTAVPLWVWEYEDFGRIQLGTLTMFAGRPAAGKSTAARWFAARISKGELPGIWHGHPMRVALYMSEEQLDAIVVPGLVAADADVRNIYQPQVRVGVHEGALMSIADETRLTDELLDNEIRVLIIDPVMAVFDGRVDIYRNNEVRQYLAPFTRIAQAINGIVLCVTHLHKGQVRDVMDNINGSSAFGEVPRAVFGFAPVEGGEHIMEQVKNSAGPTGLKLAYKLPIEAVTVSDGQVIELPRFEIVGPADLSISDIYGTGEDQDATTASADIAWLQHYLEVEQPAPSARIKADARAFADMSESRLHRARKRLRVKIINDPQLPDRPHQTSWCLSDWMKSW